MFSGDEQAYDLWEVRFLGYLAIQNLKKTILPSEDNPDASKNEKAYAELVMLLDEKSLSMVMTDAADNGRKALSILRDHYRGSSKPRILTLYTNLCNLRLVSNEGLTEYVSRAERLATSLKTAGEAVSDSLLIAMVMKGLPEGFNNFITVVTQSAKDYTFLEFKAAIRNYSENEKSRSTCTISSTSSGNQDSVMKLSNGSNGGKCYGCQMEGHYARQCPTLYCTHCKMKGHSDEKCRSIMKSDTKDSVKYIKDNEHHSYAF